MKITEIIRLSEQPDPRQAVMDIILTIAGEGLDSIALEQIISELQSMGIDSSREALYDIIMPIDVVDTIKDDIVYFYTTSPGSRQSNGTEEESDKKKVSQMAKKKLNREL